MIDLSNNFPKIILSDSLSAIYFRVVGSGEVPSTRARLDFEEEATNFLGAIGREKNKQKKKEREGIQQSPHQIPTQQEQKEHTKHTRE